MSTCAAVLESGKEKEPTVDGKSESEPDWLDEDDGDYGDYARSVASDEEW